MQIKYVLQLEWHKYPAEVDGRGWCFSEWGVASIRRFRGSWEAARTVHGESLII